MSNEAAYYATLKRIAKDYQTPSQLERSAAKEYGLPYIEVLEMAYENLQDEARRAIKGKRDPGKAIRALPSPQASRSAK